MNVVIVEDEPLIAKRIRRQSEELLKDKLPEFHMFDDLDSAADHIDSHNVDLLLLDLNLHGEDGFELLQHVTAEAFHTIIISAYAEKAITAFEYGVLDFIAKPFSKERLQKAFSRLSGEQSTSSQMKYVSIKKHQRRELVALDSIIHIQADGHYTQLVDNEGQQHLHDKAIDKLEMLLPSKFMRVHRSHIVNLDKVSSLKIESGGKYHLEMDRGNTVPVSRSFYPHLKKRLAM